MSFLALAPGVHTIEALTLTDVETQHALMLRFGRAFQLRCIRHCLRFTFRTSMDVVVHETEVLS